MKKSVLVRILGVGMTLIMAFTPLSAFASNQSVMTLDLNQEIQNAQSGITDVPITDEMKRQVEATFVNDNGDNVLIEVDCTIKELGKVKSNGRNATEGTMYTMTAITRASEKPHDAETKAYGVRAYGTITWIDNFGSGNELTEISGGWIAVESGSKVIDANGQNSRSVVYGIFPNGVGGDLGNLKTLTPGKDTFSKTGLSMKGFKLGMRTNAKVQDRNGKSGTITLTCIPLN